MKKDKKKLREHDHDFSLSYIDEFYVMDFSGNLRPAKETKYRCSNCNITERYFRHIGYYEKLDNAEREVRNHEQYQKEGKLNRNGESYLKELRKTLAELQFITDCKMVKISGKHIVN